MCLQALAVVVVLLLASVAACAGGRAGVTGATALSPSSDGSTARRSTLCSSGLFDSRESGLDSGGGSSSGLRGNSSLGGSGGLGGGWGSDNLLGGAGRGSAQVGRTGVGLDVRGDLVDSKGSDVVALERGDERAG